MRDRRFRRFTARVAALSLGAGLCSVSLIARADVDRVVRTNDGDRMTFKDDPLHANVGLPFGERLVVRPLPYKLMLIRPRAHFIPEMLKSVEHL